MILCVSSHVGVGGRVFFFLFLLKSIGLRPVDNPKFVPCFREVQSLLLNLGCLEHGTV